MSLQEEQKTEVEEEVGRPEQNYDSRPRDDSHYRQRSQSGSGRGGNGRGYGRGNGRGNYRGDHNREFQERPQERPQGNRYEYRPYRARPFVLDFNRFVQRPEVHGRIMDNFNSRMETGETKEMFHWASPVLNNFGVGETVSVRFENESDIYQYVVTAKYLRGEVNWVHAMPDNAKFDFRLKKV